MFMHPSPSVAAILVLAAFVTSAVSGVVGMVGSTLLMGITGLVLPYNRAVPVHGASSAISNASRCLWLWPRVPKKLLAAFALGVPVGAWAGYAVLSRIAQRSGFLLLLIGIIALTLSKPKGLAGFRIPWWGFAILGAVSTLLACLVGSVGPLIVPFLVRDDLEKEQFVALKAAFQLLIHLAKLPIFFLLAFPYREYLPLLVMMGLASIVGSRTGLALLHRLDRAQFVRVVKLALIVVACTIGYRVSVDLFPVASEAVNSLVTWLPVVRQEVQLF